MNQMRDMAWPKSYKNIMIQRKAKVIFFPNFQVTKIDERYEVTKRAGDIDQKFGVKDKIGAVAETVKAYGSSVSFQLAYFQALDTEPGKKVKQFYDNAMKTATEIQNECKAEEKPQ